MIQIIPILNTFALEAVFLAAGCASGSPQAGAETHNTVEDPSSEIEKVAFHVIGLMKTKSGAT